MDSSCWPNCQLVWRRANLPVDRLLFPRVDAASTVLRWSPASPEGRDTRASRRLADLLGEASDLGAFKFVARELKRPYRSASPGLSCRPSFPAVLPAQPHQTLVLSARH